MKCWYFKMSIYENIMFSTITSLGILNSKLSYLGHSREKLIEWLADLTIWIGSGEKVVFCTEHIFHINLIQADLEANDLIDHGQLLVQGF